MPKYIAIEGVIGVGKTTLARLLQPHFDAEILLEVFEENPFLPVFYQDRERYAFQTQLFFLLSRYQQQRQGLKELQGRNLVSDYTFAKDELFAWINLKDDELAMYGKVHAALAERLPRPNLIVFLQASHPVLMRRIALRDRPYERDMDPGYIRDLASAYEMWLANMEDVPQLIIDTDRLDFLASEEDLKSIVAQIFEQLAARGTGPLGIGGLTAPPTLTAPGDGLTDMQRFHRELDEYKQFNDDMFMNFIMLADEIGELANALAHVEKEARTLRGQGMNKKKALRMGLAQQRDAMAGELADVLAYVIKMANYAGIDLESAYIEKMRHNIQRKWE
jgi:deoxyadenosine/deoxycytidine kinase/NTP pyrophosphatase (non-canonical NTP hydrolase)